MADLPNSSQSKLGKLPWEIRQELNRRMRNGALSPELLPWLNSLPELRRLGDDVEITAKNLSDYRQVHYANWLDQQQRNDWLLEKRSNALEISMASGFSMADGAAQVRAGQLLDSADYDGEERIDEIELIRKGDHRAQKIQHEKEKEANRRAEHREKMELRNKELDQRRYEHECKIQLDVERVTKEAIKKALEIATISQGSGAAEEKMQKVAELIFGAELLAERERRRQEALNG